MKTKTLTLYEIRTIGFEALLRELGPAGAIRFIQQYESGHGDYTRNRKRRDCNMRFCHVLFIFSLGSSFFIPHAWRNPRKPYWPFILAI